MHVTACQTRHMSSYKDSQHLDGVKHESRVPSVDSARLGEGDRELGATLHLHRTEACESVDLEGRGSVRWPPTGTDASLTKDAGLPSASGPFTT